MHFVMKFLTNYIGTCVVWYEFSYQSAKATLHFQVKVQYIFFISFEVSFKSTKGGLHFQVKVQRDLCTLIWKYISNYTGACVVC